MNEKISQSKDYIAEKIAGRNPKIALILGSGLGEIADELVNPISMEYNDIPNFPRSTVEGHKGRLVLGELSGVDVLAMQGRFHFYEGYSMQDITFHIRVFKQLGIEKVIVTNAAGGVNLEFKPGDLMLITDHINFALTNPLIGKNLDEFGPRFPDTSRAYSPRLNDIARRVASESGIDLKEGTYMFFTGPTYETKAEIRMARTLHADAVGMSTVPEVLVCAHSGIEVLGISLITNMAAGILDQPLSHDEVVETATMVKETFKSLVNNLVSNI